MMKNAQRCGTLLYYANECIKGQSLSQPHNNVVGKEELIFLYCVSQH